MSQTTLPGTDIDLTDDDVSAIDELGNVYRRLCAELGRVIVGQNEVIEQLAICLFARGHGLLMGVPGLAKTLLVSKLAETMSLKFSRIQFTPDLMPMDITGTDILQDGAGGRREFQFVHGPVFANIVLADEINRAPPKTQAAMLEAMQERRVTAIGKPFVLDAPFLVLATQNPVEQEGTYPLPEAQLDRFMFLIELDYPSEDEEIEIARTTTGDELPALDHLLKAAEIIYVSESRPPRAGAGPYLQVRRPAGSQDPAAWRHRARLAQAAGDLGRRSAGGAEPDPRRPRASRAVGQLHGAAGRRAARRRAGANASTDHQLCRPSRRPQRERHRAPAGGRIGRRSVSGRAASSD